MSSQIENKEEDLQVSVAPQFILETQIVKGRPRVKTLLTSTPEPPSDSLVIVRKPIPWSGTATSHVEASDFGVKEQALMRLDTHMVEASDFGIEEQALMDDNHSVLEIDAQGYRKNYKELERFMNSKGSKALICPVLKADAYGHGIDLLMPVLIDLNVGWVAVTSNREAWNIRKLRYKNRILRVRIATEMEMLHATEMDVDEVIGSFELAKLFSDAIESNFDHRKPKVRFHLALNSGNMSRESGLNMNNKDDLKEAIDIVKLPHLELVGIMTHFADQTESKMKSCTEQFREESAILIKALSATQYAQKKLLLHAAASAGVILVPSSHFDMVRVGTLLYGQEAPVGALNGFQFSSLVQFKSSVACVRFFAKGSPVGYGSDYKVDHDCHLANVPVGYSDGYPRLSQPSQSTVVLVGGHRCKTVGAESMNVLMADVTEAMADTGVKAGDEVVLFGKQAKEEITRANIEELSGRQLSDLLVLWGALNPKYGKGGDHYPSVLKAVSLYCIVGTLLFAVAYSAGKRAGKS